MPLRTIWRPWKWASVVLSGGLLAGCSTSEKKLSYVGDADLDHYKDVVTSIDYPAVNQETPDEVSFSDEPRRIRRPRKEEVWDLGLEEAVHTALANNELIRDNGSFLSPQNRLLSNPDFVQSVYDPALQETNTQFGQNGVESALSEFDAQFTTNLLVGRSENISETNSFNNIQAGDTLETTAGDFRAGLSKIFADGSQASLQHNVLYQAFNNGTGTGAGGTRLFQSYFTNNPSATQNSGIPGLQFDYRKPLWQGGGTRFTRIAGPIISRRSLTNVTQVNQGVVISRIRTDIAIAEFESQTQNLVKDVEDLYWELYLAYRRYDAELTARNSSLHTWRKVKANTDAGVENVSAADEAQARDSYFEVRARSEEALSNLYNTEGRFRRLIGLPVNDGRIIRPGDEPTTAEFQPDWRTSLVEALTRRVELRKQKWNIKSLEFQVEAAESLTNPRLDLVGRYAINGFGDQLFGHARHNPTGPLVGVPPATNVSNGRTGSFYDNLLDADNTGYGIGVEFSMPIGFRAAHSQVRNLELRLCKARAALSAQEFEISHELANAFRQLDASFQTAQTNFNRRRAAERRVQAYEAQYEAGKGNVDNLLRSQISLAQAETAYYQSIVSYNRAITEMKYRKGTLMEDDNIFLGESLSHPEAYVQALRHAWARSHASDADKLATLPEEFVTNQSDPAELGSATYSGAGDPRTPAPPEPVPASELPVVPQKPLPLPAEPAPPTNKELNGSTESEFIEDSVGVQPAALEIPPEPESEELIQQLDYQPQRRAATRSQPQSLPSDSQFRRPIRSSQSPTAKELTDEDDDDDMEEELEENR
ncbi:MAG: TolC family protein [Planctomycetaceae bacterium]